MGYLINVKVGNFLCFLLGNRQTVCRIQDRLSPCQIQLSPYPIYCDKFSAEVCRLSRVPTVNSQSQPTHNYLVFLLLRDQMTYTIYHSTNALSFLIKRNMNKHHVKNLYSQSLPTLWKKSNKNSIVNKRGKKIYRRLVCDPAYIVGRLTLARLSLVKLC